MLVAAADELQSGVPVVDAGGVGADLGLEPGTLLLGALLGAPMALGLLFEPVLLAWSDRADRRRLLLGALLAMAFFAAAGALSPSAAALSLAIGLWGSASGIAAGLAQGALLQSDGDPDRAMARWVRGGVVGDLLAPALVGGVALLGGDWRAAMLLAALLPALGALGVARLSLPPLVDEDEPDEPLAESLRAALRDRRLFGWSLAVASCGLLDETLLVLVSLAVGDGPAGTLAVGALYAGSTLGGFATEALLARLGARGLLLGASTLSAATLTTFVLLPASALPSLFLLGVACTQLYPLAQARALACRPDRPGLVLALQQPLAWVDVLAPLLLGAVLGRWGVGAALLSLLLQPLVFGVAALRMRSRDDPDPGRG